MKESTKASLLKIREKLTIRFTIFRKLPLLLSLTRRAFLFFVFFLAAQFFVFFTGNIQNFLDENLNLILLIICCTSIGTAFFSFAAAAECIYYIITTRKMYFYVHLSIFLIFFIAALIISIATNSIGILSGGINL